MLIQASAKPRVAAYARVSTDLDTQESSYDNQIEIYKRKIQNNPEWEFAGVYSDKDCTGTNVSRPGFTRMMEDANAGIIDIILVKSISRFARNVMITIEKIRYLKSIGVRIIFEKEKIDTADNYSEMVLTILSAFCQEESRNISERVKTGLKMRAHNSQVRWCPTYGYRKGKNGEYIVNGEEAEVVKKIFELYSEGSSIMKITNGLNEELIPGPRGGIWKKETVRDILHNIKYTGDIITNKYITVDYLSHKIIRNDGTVERIHIRGHHTPIISLSLFESVRDKLCSNDSKRSSQKPFYDNLKCPYCNSSLHKKRMDAGTFWACVPFSKNDNENHCGTCFIPSDIMERKIANVLGSTDCSFVKESERVIKGHFPDSEIFLSAYDDGHVKCTVSQKGKTVEIFLPIGFGEEENT